jgi:hypothetical protein
MVISSYTTYIHATAFVARTLAAVLNQKSLPPFNVKEASSIEYVKSSPADRLLGSSVDNTFREAPVNESLAATDGLQIETSTFVPPTSTTSLLIPTAHSGAKRFGNGHALNFASKSGTFLATASSTTVTPSSSRKNTSTKSFKSRPAPFGC